MTNEDHSRLRLLARNLALAYNAYHLGTTMATQEKNYKHQPKPIGDLWYVLADTVEQEVNKSVDAHMKTIKEKASAIQ